MANWWNHYGMGLIKTAVIQDAWAKNSHFWRHIIILITMDGKLMEPLWNGTNKNGSYTGCLSKEFSFLTPHYNIDYNGWQIDGTIMEWDYSILDQSGYLTESSKSPAEVAKSNKQWVGTCLYQEGYKPLLINCEAVIRLWASSGSGLRISDWLARVNKELFHMTDTYVIDVQNPGNALDALMFVLAIDAEKCSRN